jgi:CRISPR-associated protein Cst1
MHMTQERIEKIRTLADELAEEIKVNNDKPLYRQLMGIAGGRDAYAAFRQLLIRATRERLRRDGELLLTLDDYLKVFEEGEEFPHTDWRLARDLIRLRSLEKLYALGYFEQAPELLEEAVEEEEESDFA